MSGEGRALLPPLGGVPAEIPGLGDNPRHTEARLLLCVEEPEIYQNPVRARHFARVLTDLSADERWQVLLATHSPYFVLLSQFESLRRFTADQGVARVVSTSTAAISTASDVDKSKVMSCVEREVPRRFSEGFFADGVALVEGETDRVVIEVLAERLGTPLDSAGIAVLSMDSKQNLRIPAAILQGIGVPVYVIADGDALGGQRKHPGNEECASRVTASHREATEKLLDWLPKDVEQRFGTTAGFDLPTSVTSSWTLFYDDLEEELASWPGFDVQLNVAGGQLRGKNVSAYRAAAYLPPLDVAPVALRELVIALIAFGSIQRPIH
jgi:putative ATP-dependent endonuclease of the OLD family